MAVPEVFENTLSSYVGVKLSPNILFTPLICSAKPFTTELTQINKISLSLGLHYPRISLYFTLFLSLVATKKMSGLRKKH